METPVPIDTQWIIWMAGLLGLLAGGWLAPIVERLPRVLEYEWEHAGDAAASQAAASRRPRLWGAGVRCGTCNAAIRGWARVPVLGWMMRRGRCGACGRTISWRRPLLEALCASLFAVMAWRFGASPQALCAMGLVAGLLALAWIDAETGLLPDVITLPLMWAGLLVNTQHVFAAPAQAIWGAAAGYVLLRVLHHLFRWATGRDGMGYGDFKLAAALGAWLGLAALPMVLIVASSAGVAVGMALIAAGRLGRHQPQPFGPYLALAGIVALIVAGASAA
ncbi:prepilin peptidase [Bordetella genomosp. 9]|uniref:Prepilin leader peptidase/N-methyltransferase n=1 Tax=Bordetella genomosp. 9 TaxID=1416803 RepID=A0A1W6Z3Q5_9BORD|nr:A24 family peptidase [Bordetella genomosp. 9]ARP88000.1 prepilin peptidase [Bordetella genomosp. 9]